MATIEELWTAEINTVGFVTGNPDMTSQIRASVNNELPQDQQKAIHSVLLAHQQCFTGSSKDWGHCKLLSHKITTQDVRPIHQHPYPSAFKQRELLQQQVEEMLEDGVIEPSNSTWSSPVILVRKKDGSYRFCADYRKLNLVTVKDFYPLPRIDDTLSRLEKTRYFSSMDLTEHSQDSNRGRTRVS